LLRSPLHVAGCSQSAAPIAFTSKPPRCALLMMSLLCGQQAFIPPLGVLLHAQRKVAHQLIIRHPMAVSGGFWHHTSSQLPGMQAAVPCNVSVYRHASDTAIVLAGMSSVQAHMVQARFCYLHLQAPPWAPVNPCCSACCSGEAELKYTGFGQTNQPVLETNACCCSILLPAQCVQRLVMG
jgi:hypothetical protein